MEHRLDKIEAKLDKILDRVSDQRERLARVETVQKGFMSVLSGLWIVLAAAVGSIAKKLHWG